MEKCLSYSEIIRCNFLHRDLSSWIIHVNQYIVCCILAIYTVRKKSKVKNKYHFASMWLKIIFQLLVFENFKARIYSCVKAELT